MSANFSVQFIVNEKTQSRVLKLTDTSTGFTLAKGNFSITFPDGSTRIKTDFTSPDINTPGGGIFIPAVTDNNNNVITGAYKIDFAALDASNTAYSASYVFDFNWVKPTKNIVNLSDTMIPEVKFQDSTVYTLSGSFTGVLTSRTFNVLMPTTSAVTGTTITAGSNLIDAIVSSNYYEGVYTPKADIVNDYTHTSNSWLTVVYTDLLQTTFSIKKAPTRLELITRINLFRTQVDAYKELNDTQFQILSEVYDILIALYSHLIERAQTSTLDGSQPILVEILDILDKYTPYTYQSAPISAFYIQPFGLGTVTSVGLTAPTGLSVSSSPITTSGTIGLSFTSGYSIPTTIKQSNWDDSYTWVSAFPTQTSNAGKYLTTNGSALSWANVTTGTVTSVGLSAPSAFTVSNSPVTSSGTLTFAGAGTTLQYIDGTGALQTFPTTLPSTNMQTIGRNSTGSILYKGTVVYISGSTGNRPNFVKAQASGESTSAGTFGVVVDDIANNTDGYVVTIGTLDNLDTRSSAAHPFTSDTLADGDTIYLSPTTAGYVTNVKPSAPNHLVYIGKVVRTTPTNGTIVYRIQNGYELDEIHDVQVGSYVNKDILYRDTTLNLWKNASIATILGYTPLQNNQTITLSGAVTGSGTTAITTTLANSVVGVANLSATGTPSSTTYLRGDNTWTTISGVGSVTSVAALTLGTTGTDLTSTVANGTTTPVITLNVPTASATNRGALSSADWTTFNSKQGAITLTTTGTSGAATLVGNTLNIPNYASGGGSGTVTTVSVTTANGISGTVATATTTPAITLTLGAITPTTVNGVTISGSTTPTLAVTGTSSISGSNTGDNAVNSLYSGLVSNATHTGDATGSTALTVVGLRGVTLPTLGVSAGLLKYTGTGTNTWIFDTTAYGTGTVTSVAALTLGTTGTDVSSTVATGTTTPVITLNIPTASATNRGALSSADWSTFNNKQGAITLTTTGTSGAATLVGNTLNIPNYATGGGGGSGTVTSVSVVSANGFAGTVATDTTTPAITISTSITGILKGNGTAISAAAAGTDYQAPLSGTGFVKSTAGTISYDTNTYAVDSGVVHTTGTETVGGAKTFSSLLSATSGLSVNGGVLTGNNIVSIRAGATGGQFRIEKSDGTLSAYPFYIGSDGTALAYFYNSAGTLKIQLHTNGTNYFGNSLAVGQAAYTTATEMIDVNGYVKATGFKIPSGLSTQYLMADGSTSTAISGSGTVTSVSVVSANGFAGTVATATSTPAITISTSITGVLKGNGTAISAAVANTDYLAVSNPVYTGTLGTGTLTYTPANVFQYAQQSVNSYIQAVFQNSNAGASASSDVIVNNNLSTDTANYGDFGINSSGFTGTGSLSLPNAVYLSATTGDLVLGTTTSNVIRFVVNSGATDAAIIKTTSQLQLPSYTTTSSFTGTAVGVLGFDASGNILTVASGGSSFSGTLAAGTATTAPLDFTTAGSVLKTTPVAGDFEADTAGIFYYTHAASSRGVVHSEQFIALSGTYTLTSQTAAQKLFNSTTNGAVTVQAATTYYFECFYSLSSMSGTTGSFGFAIGGTATLTSVNWTSYAIKATTAATAATLQTTFNTTASNTALVSTSTQTGGSARITGTIRVNAGGTIIPQVSLGVAAAAIVGANSYFRIIPIGTNTVTSVGNWS